MNGDDQTGRTRRGGSASARPDHFADLARRRPTVPARDFRRFLRLIGIGALIPGVGLISAGRRWLGGVLLAAFIGGSIAVVGYVVSAGRSGLLRLSSDADTMGVLGMAGVGVAVIWLLTAVTGLYLLEPPGLRVQQRLLAVVVVVVTASVAVAPVGVGSRYAFTQRDFIDSVFADDDQRSLTIPKDATDEDPWAGEPRVNVLILGADSGDDREGTRTDTVMVASIDTENGDTALFSLPRNLQYAPMPKGPMRDAYPDGYHGQPTAEYWISSIYRNVPVEFPEVFEEIADPGAEAMKLVAGEVLGLDISYYVMVNLRGFQYLVDALGGIELDVPYPIPIGTKALPSGRCTQETGWIDEGANQHLDGYQALWFARARCGPGPVSDDYERMRRQRCVIGAIADQADPFVLLTRYQQLASAAKDTMSTDIPQSRLADFAELSMKIKDAGIRSLPFTNDIIEYEDPDYDVINEFVEESLEAPATPSPETTNQPAESPKPTGDTSDRPGGEPDAGDSTGTGSSGDPDLTEPTPEESETPGESGGAQSIDDVC